MNTELTSLLAKALPRTAVNTMTYNAKKHQFITCGYTSDAGNTYYNVIRASSRLAIILHIGQGYRHTFLNGITLLAWNGSSAKIIASHKWGGVNSWTAFDEQRACKISVGMLNTYLFRQARLSGKHVEALQISNLSKRLVYETRGCGLIS